ncbi:flavin monoamine oxidase family protein [Piscinibacter terrae]|uniref:flavin monoamine oxidase family protein n=1 Tax=Piscinibacter terrae TaxID=2496871 RepID=UPI001F25D9CA|nr:FAD-dependent oxidoreductase [Albitalea terrae]
MNEARRRLLAAAAWAPLAGCSRREPTYDGGWVGAQHERGHRLHELKSGSLPAPAVERRAGVLIVGAGIAGLSCARTLARQGVDDVHLLELEDVAGGNSRGHRIAGMGCPLGAHYLPVPGEHAEEVSALMDEFGLRRQAAGQWVYDERHLCHSPQERLFIHGQWHEGLLPPVDALPAAERDPTLAHYRRFAQLVNEAGANQAFTMPTWRSRWTDALAALDALTFAAWLDQHQLTAPALRWYLDYCCRDDYGGSASDVSAWAGLHYFASRHGFHAPGMDHEERDGILTWPEGNAWLAQRLIQPLGDRVHAGMLAMRVSPGREEVVVDAWNARQNHMERWTARHVVMAVPLFLAVRLIDAPPPALAQIAPRMRYAPWLVANLHIDRALDDHPGPELSWDNVLYGSASLGYVDDMHQSTRPYPDATVLTSYWSWSDQRAHRETLLAMPWRERSARVIAELATAHPDLPGKVRRVDLMRYGHAMSIPAPGIRSHPALRALQSPAGRLSFAHADLSSYSVFEEACFHGVRAAKALRS